MSEIEWRRVPFAPLYEVSNLGGVRRAARGRSTRPGRLLKPWQESNGYLRVTFRIDGKSVKHWLQRVVAFAFHGDPPTPDHEAAHGDGVKSNNRAENLSWKTPAENSADSKAHGTRIHGDQHPGSKLTAADVAAIRARYTGRRGQQTELAREYGVGQPIIFGIVNGKSWVETATQPTAATSETRI
ncbi:endodeoxyribonuclease [Mesorhizobium sp. M1A.F.Ca.IN.020.03.2.1]|uniref:HNH endonuclease n=1 Tax=Mesorhizobium sp. M1A.F.Ca.IN.020.03.2.1 TaxID=2496769 RepID=UPI000FD473D9|nr:HNH endonuclease [Mesorhizobium sp. M1A.F.Ca.IN.020.03.2.1]RUV07983.1 endodeoxyribonuclease [Mesorhizobium sp. M1A.F.Ca.IN.020.03.2.1]